ncbi:MAG: carboxypeptidase-like regulatory domain-containing protein [Terracidiphilus sp.]
MKKVGAWLAGLLAVVLGGWLTWYLTRPPAVTTVEGMVYTGDAAVPNAMVEIDLTGDSTNTGPVHDLTDQNGSYRIEFTGLPHGAGAVLRVAATGYQDAQPQTLASPLQTDTHLDFALIHAVATPSGGAPPPMAPAHPPTHIAHIPAYIPKAANKATMIRIR